MRRKIIFYLCIVLMLIAIFGGRIAWVFYTFDTQQYVQQITADLEKSTGLRLQVQGKVRKELFPHPRLYVEQVSCFDGNEGEPVLIASEVSLKTHWSSLLADSVSIYRSKITNLHLFIDASKSSGRKQWVETLLQNKSVIFNYLKSISVRNGTISYRGKDGKSYLINKLNGKLLPSQKKNELLHWEGSGTYHDLTYFSSFLLNQSDGTSFPWQLQLDTPGQENRITIDGRIDENLQSQHISGTLDITSANAASLLSATGLYHRPPKSLALPLRLSVQFDYTPRQFALTQIALRVGQGNEAAHLTGTATYRYNDPETPNSTQAQIYIDGPEKILQPLVSSSNFSSYNLFQWLGNHSPEFQVHLVAENTSVYGLPISHMEADIAYRQPDMYIKNLSVQGLMSATGDGIWSVTKEDFALDLALKASISNLSYFVRQYPLAISSYIDLTHSFPVSVACDVHKSRSAFALYNLKIGLPDKASITGEFKKAEGQSTSVLLNLSQINLADFIHHFDFRRTATPLQTLKKTLTGVATAQIWEVFPLHIEVTGNDLSWEKSPLSAVRLNADIERQKIRINQFSASWPNGVNLQNVKGELQKDVNGQIRLHEIHYQLGGQSLADFGISSTLVSWIPGPLLVTGILNGTTDQVQTTSSFQGGDITAFYEGTISQQAPYYEGLVQASSSSFEPISYILWQRSNPFTRLDGHTELSAQIRLDEEHLNVNALHMHVGDLQLDGRADLSKDDIQYVTLTAPQLDMHLLYLPEIKDILHMELSGLKTWDIHFDTPELVTWNDLVIRYADAHILMRPTQWELLDLKGVINHGDLRASGQMQKTKEGATLSAQIGLKNAHINNVAVPPLQLQTGMLSMDLQFDNPQVDDASKMQGTGTFTLNQATVENLNLSGFVAQAVRLPLSQQFKKDRASLVKALLSGSFTIPEVTGQFKIDGPTFSIPEFEIKLPDATIKAQASGQNKTLLGTLQILFALPIEQTPPPVSVAFTYGTKDKTSTGMEHFYTFLTKHLPALRKHIFKEEQQKRKEELGTERQAQTNKNNKERAELAQSLRQQVQDSFQKTQALHMRHTLNKTAEQIYQQLEQAIDTLEQQVKAPMSSEQLDLVRQQTAVCMRLMQDIRRAQQEDPVFFAQQRTQELYQKSATLFKTLAPLYAKHPSYQNEHLYQQAQKAMTTIANAKAVALQDEKLENIEEKERTIKAQFNLLQQIEKKMKALSQ